jgi:hypothetical protein
MDMYSALGHHHSRIAAHDGTFRHGATHHGSKGDHSARANNGSRGKHSASRDPGIGVNTNRTESQIKTWRAKIVITGA